MSFLIPHPAAATGGIVDAPAAPVQAHDSTVTPQVHGPTVSPQTDDAEFWTPDDDAAVRNGSIAPSAGAPAGPRIYPQASALRAPFPDFLRGTLTPPAPFPLVINGVASALTTIAPGVRTFDETLFTSAGPLLVHGILINPRMPSVQIRTILAHDHIVSPGETLSSMASRTGAVAGINGDYFNIRQTNEPLGVVIDRGVVIKTPSRRVALALDASANIMISAFRLGGTATWDTRTVALTGVNNYPPEGGASLILPSFGTPRPRPGVHFIRLAPLVTTPAGTSYRVLGEADIPPTGQLGIALGPAALRTAAIPQEGETLVIAQTTEPAADKIVAAIGGGPQLVAGHAVSRDTTDPLNDESGTRFPLSGLARMDSGELLMLAVDGRAPARSVGLTRSEFGALFLALGASDAMCLDSGGSTTIVARLPGEERARVRNYPSDGRERRIGDGLLAFSSGPAPAVLPAAAPAWSAPARPPASRYGTGRYVIPGNSAAPATRAAESSRATLITPAPLHNGSGRPVWEQPVSSEPTGSPNSRPWSRNDGDEEIR